MKIKCLKCGADTCPNVAFVTPWPIISTCFVKDSRLCANCVANAMVPAYEDIKVDREGRAIYGDKPGPEVADFAKGGVVFDGTIPSSGDNTNRPEHVISEDIIAAFKRGQTNDVVNSPSHYTDGGIQPSEYIKAKGLNYNLGNVIKYVSRAGKKDPSKLVEDLMKAAWYLDAELSGLYECYKTHKQLHDDSEAWRNAYIEEAAKNSACMQSEKRLAEVIEQRNKLSEAFSVEKNVYENRIEISERRIQALEQERNKLKSNYTALEFQLESLKQELSNTRHGVTHRNEVIDKLQVECGALEKQKIHFQTEANKLREEIEEYRNLPREKSIRRPGIKRDSSYIAPMTLNELRDIIYQTNIRNGFWGASNNVGEKLMLIVSELGEAIEAHRTDKFFKGATHDDFGREFTYDPKAFHDKVKDTFQDEMADAIIRILDLCGYLGINIDWHIRRKMEYNATRELLHGKKY